MDRIFKSKVGWWYHLLMGMLAVGCVVAVTQHHIGVIIAALIAAMLALYVFFNTYYIVTADGMLVLHCGFFPTKTIAIADITALQSSVLPVFSYALSLDRIIIWKGEQVWMLVSPRNREAFVRLLRQTNPAIVIRTTNDLL